ncbi:MAG: glutamate 5-kinase [Alphaproteobacteria bacterium]|nr:glutamate 5-kinase [Alphaproteobacteria bacterium]
MKPSQFKRVVVKVGSALLVDHASGLPKTDWLNALCDDLAALVAKGAQVLVVSSGAIALGRAILKLPRGPLTLDQSQAAAAVGQIALSSAWSVAFDARGLKAAQILLTLGDTEERRKYLNARATLSTLLGMGAVPVINENDTVATAEIKYGDNDRLAARVASMAEADGLILLSDIDGMYTANPQKDSAAKFLDVIERITPEIEAMAGGAASEFSRGGMKTKVDAAKIATGSGCTMLIASGKIMHPVKAIEDGGKCTVFKAAETPLQARKKWIAGAMAPAGVVVVDDGAAAALANGKSLLPAGVRKIDGAFGKGDVVAVRDGAGRDLARGLVAYDAAEAVQIAGKKSAEIESILGAPFRAELIHRDDMVML